MLISIAFLVCPTDLTPQPHYKSTIIRALIDMSQPSIPTRPEDEAFVVSLIIVAIGVGSLFTVGKTVGNYFLGSTTKEKQHRGKAGLAPEAKKEQYGPRTNKGDETQKLGRQLPAVYHDRDRAYEAGLKAIRAWEDSSINRIQREKTRRLERLPPLDQPHSSTQKQDLHAILAWEQSTMRRFENQKTRRLDRLLSPDDEDDLASEKEQGRQAVRDWESAARRQVAQDEGLRSVKDWERVEMKRSQSERVIGEERSESVENDGRPVLWKHQTD